MALVTECAAAYMENRAEPRFDCHIHVLGASTIAFDGTVRDVSVSGLCLTTQAPIEFESGSQLHLDFELPTGRVEAVGEVRRATPGGDGELVLGVRFVRISTECVDAIREAADLERYGA
jgi:hypothetical protein